MRKVEKKKRKRTHAEILVETFHVVKDISELRPDLRGLVRFIPPDWNVNAGDSIHDLVVEDNEDCIKILMIISRRGEESDT